MRYLLFAAIGAITAIFPFLFRSHLPGADSYAQMHLLYGFPPIVVFFTASWFFILLTGVLALKLGVAEHLNPGLFLLGAPAWVLRSTLLENDMFGVLFCLAATIFFIEMYNTDNLADKFINSCAFLSCALPCALIWVNGLTCFLLLWCIFALRKNKIGLIALGIIALRVVPKPNLVVGESTLGILMAVFYIGLMFVGFVWLKRNKVHPFLWIMTLYFCGLAAITTQFMWLAAIPLAMLCALYTQNNQMGAQIIIVVGLMIGWLLIGAAPPTTNDISMLDHVVSVTGDGVIANDWHLGYWINYRGGVAMLTPAHPENITSKHSKVGWVLSAVQSEFGEVEYCYDGGCLYKTV